MKKRNKDRKERDRTVWTRYLQLLLTKWTNSLENYQGEISGDGRITLGNNRKELNAILAYYLSIVVPTYCFIEELFGLVLFRHPIWGMAWE